MRRYLVLLGVLLLTIAIFAKTPSTKQHGKGSGGAKTYTPDKMEWNAAPTALPSGAELAVLEGDPMKPGPYTMRLKMPDGYHIPPHMHMKREHVTVVSGELHVGLGDSFDEKAMSSFSPGSFAYLEPGTHHYAMSKGETVIQLHGMGPWGIKYVNPADDPRKKQP
jgi:mannose-6-phosphate isomerase-like protein (cupin superfamily)